MKIMAFGLVQMVLILFLMFSYTYAVAEEQNQQSKQTYIIRMDKTNMPSSFNDHSQWYAASLKSVSDSADMLYTYDTIIHGFSTQLTAEEAESLEKQPGILAVLPEERYELHTTRSPKFLGLDKADDTLFPTVEQASEVIIGVLDTGVWPELRALMTRDLVLYQVAGKVNVRDDDGHGTHTSTTAAGSAVEGANLLNYALGTARGMAPHARVAIYKVCWLGGCFTADIAAAIEKAIEDGVHVISMSIGGGINSYDKDIVAIGAFKATSQGILVSCSAGNGGPTPESVTNIAPWITTVGAGTLDRDFPVEVSLGNGKNYTGVSLYNGKQLSDSLVPLVYAGNVSNSSFGSLCLSGTLNPGKVAGKIVVCDRGLNSRTEKGLVVKNAGGVGMMLANTDSFGEELLADAHLLPTAALGQNSADAIKAYISSDSNPTATIGPAVTKLGVQPSPVVAAFSSRGPNPLTPGILKPDLIAPGVNILAGWTGAVGPTGLDNDKRRVSFNIISGTSMSCPHISGLAAFLKAVHQEWSPAAIRSALMTTAYTTYTDGETIKDVATGKSSTPFDYGAGHVNPLAALDPGLVYDLTVVDYLDFLCALHYSPADIKSATNLNFTCDSSKKYSLEDFNYPSFAVPVNTTSDERGGDGAPSKSVKYTRTLTNVGTPATYKVSVSSQDPSVKILVEPESLTFSEQNEKKSYTVTFNTISMPSGTTSFAHLKWSDGKHIVGSPIAFSWT
ncbi:hypothetical protein CMV_001692 [Castanea mollissima]|uniref:Subtilisin-like protease SBT1.7 n=1 Tax=Castanea mollissima TaxID=60419 RepID=A0A8J4VXS9_9ROSI|nr:hypothetical protein CMV_001692 [Castanea mollissima]